MHKISEFIRINENLIINKKNITSVSLHDCVVNFGTRTGHPTIRTFDSKDEANQWIIKNFGICE